MKKLSSFLKNQLQEMDQWTRRKRLFKSLTDDEQCLFILLYQTIPPTGLLSICVYEATHREPETFHECLEMLQDQAKRCPMGLIEALRQDCFIAVAELAGVSSYTISMCLLKYSIKRYEEMLEQASYNQLGEEHNVFVGELILN